MRELHDLMARATDRVESPGLEQVALEAAGRRRTRRRGTVAALASSVLVAAVFVGMQVGGPDDGRTPAPPATRTPATAPLASASPSVPQEKVWPQWDPREVDLLPAAADRIAPALPEVIDPPASSPSLSGSPVGTGVLAVEQDGLVQVLGKGGDWRTVPVDGPYPRASLSPRGTRLAIHYGHDATGEQDEGVTVHDLSSGSSRTLPPPAGLIPWDRAAWTFLDEETLLLTSGPQAFVVAIDSGRAKKSSGPIALSTAVDPAGGWLASASFEEPNVLIDHAGGTPRKVSMDRTGRLLRIQADEETVVGTTYEQPFSVLVADRETLTPQSRLPVLDHEANYSNWGLGPVAVADDGTVLLQVAAIGRRVEGFRLVAWDPDDGALSIVSSTALPVEATVTFAQGALRAVGDQDAGT